MRTWWIIRDPHGIHIWGYYYKPLGRCNIGPFWSYEEAKELLDKWITPIPESA